MHVTFYCPGCGKKQGEANVPMIANDKPLDVAYCPPCSKVLNRPAFNHKGFSEFMALRPTNKDQALAMARVLEERRRHR